MDAMEQMKYGLAPRQALFIEEMQKHGDATRAAISAGYAQTTARTQAKKMLANQKIAALLNAGKEVDGRQDTTPADVRACLMEVYQMCVERVPVIKWDTAKKEWSPTGEQTFDAKHALRAAELLGESIGMFEKSAGETRRSEGVEEYLKRLGEEAPL